MALTVADPLHLAQAENIMRRRLSQRKIHGQHITPAAFVTPEKCRLENWTNPSACAIINSRAGAYYRVIRKGAGHGG